MSKQTSCSLLIGIGGGEAASALTNCILSAGCFSQQPASNRQHQTQVVLCLWWRKSFRCLAVPPVQPSQGTRLIKATACVAVAAARCACNTSARQQTLFRDRDQTCALATAGLAPQLQLDVPPGYSWTCAPATAGRATWLQLGSAGNGVTSDWHHGTAANTRGVLERAATRQ
eukprot:351646-Chlamydomonas_euryale.AAC.2